MTVGAVSARQVATWSVTAVVVAAAAAGLWMARNVVLLVFAAWLFGVAFERAATWVASRTGMRYGASLAVTLTALVLLLGGALAAAAGTVAGQWPELRRSLRQAAATAPGPIRDALQPLIGGEAAGGGAGEAPVAQPPGAGAAGGRQGGQGDFLRQALGWLGTTLGALGSVVFVAFLAAFFAADPETYRRGVVRLTPRPHRKRMRAALRRADETLRDWLLGRLVAMTAVAVVTTVGLMVAGVPLALTLGLIAGVLDFVPNVGPLVAAIPALLLAYQEGPQTVAWVAALYAGVQLVEGYVLTPLIEKRAVELPPGVVLVAQAALGVVLGVAGLVLATPLVAGSIALAEGLTASDGAAPPERA